MDGNNYGSLINFNPPSMGGFTDDIQNTRIYTDGNRKIKGIAAAIEQRGSTAGKLWSIVVYSADSLSPDTLKVYYSVNNGVSWNMYVSGNIRPGDYITPDDLDMELVENISGQKYLWVAFGFQRVSGRKAVGAFVLQIPSINGNFFNMIEWPASDSIKSYYNIRLTTDNAQYTATPYVYIACSFDSTDSGGSKVNSQKFARILNPYSLVNPVFSFMAPNYYWYENSGAITRQTYTDIAYFINGGEDSVEVSFCGVADSTKLYFAKCDILGNPPVSSIGAGGNIGGSNPNSVKTHAKLSSNGNNNGSIVCTFREFNNGLWNVKWFSSTNYGNFEGSFSNSPLLGSSANLNFAPEITGVRNGSTHYISFLTDAAEDSIHYVSMNSEGLLNHVYKMNYFSGSAVIAPKPLFRYQSGDSCLMIYSEEGPVNMISSAGCTGAPIGLINLNNEVPADFRLMQNYPNPFNPLTKITFSIPDNAYIKLMVYDVQGREIAVLADSDYNAGNYEVTFDASSLSSGVYFCRLVAGETGNVAGGFTDIKKMVLLK
ncbi:MAG: T9SS type A sorting domain-containing protein [Ignavibacteria bacterium]|nr:T9SS type A sorting domain-containing protein [Ignavibacteria bacterium]